MNKIIPFLLIIKNGFIKFSKYFLSSITLSSLYLLISFLAYKIDATKGVLSTILILPFLLSLYALFIKEEKSLLKNIKMGFEYFIDGFYLLLLNIVIILVGLLLLLIPGIIAGILLMYSFPVLIDKNLKPWGTIKESSRIVRKHILLNIFILLYITTLTLISVYIPYIYMFSLPLGIATLIEGFKYSDKFDNNAIPK